jgi:hypothetical protein
MYDHVSLVGTVNRPIDIKYLQKEWHSDKLGAIKYSVDHGFTPADIIYYPDFGKVKMALSPPYFLFGHNFQIGNIDYRNALEYLSNLTDCDIMNFDVKSLETYAIVGLSEIPKSIVNNHLSKKGMKKQSFETGIEYEDRNQTLKIYDVRANYRRKLSVETKKQLNASTFVDGTNYIKVENHYKRPQVALKRRVITGYTLFEPDFQELCIEHLLDQYASIKKSNGLTAMKKGDINLGTIPLLILQEFNHLFPLPIPELLKQKIDSIPEDVLTGYDKKRRWQGIKKNIEKISATNYNPNDLTNDLRKSLCG